MIEIICLNAPPFGGKDTAAKLLTFMYGFHHMKYAAILKERTHAMYGLKGIPFDHYEGPIKDQPLPEFLGISPRQAYINLSEMLMKPVHGKTVWSDMLIQQIQKSGHRKIVISDCGFQTEWNELQKVENFKSLLIQIERKGCTFKGDSRGWIVGFTGRRIVNDGTVQELGEKLKKYVDEWRNK